MWFELIAAMNTTRLDRRSIITESPSTPRMNWNVVVGCAVEPTGIVPMIKLVMKFMPASGSVDRMEPVSVPKTRRIDNPSSTAVTNRVTIRPPFPAK